MITKPGIMGLLFLIGLLIVVVFKTPIIGDSLAVINPVYIYIGCWIAYLLLLIVIKRDYSVRQIAFLLSFIAFFAIAVPLSLFSMNSREVLLGNSAAYGHTVILQLLLLKSDQNEINKVLVSAASGGQEKIVRDMIQRGADVNSRISGNETALMLSINSDTYSLETIKTLIDNGADVNLRDKNGRTALMYAAEDNLPDVVKLLIEAHAEVNAKSNFGETALSISQKFHSNQVTEILETAEAYNSLSIPRPH